MSRETLLDDAITKAKEAEDWQLVEWLRMARGGESAARWYTEKLRDAHRTIRKLLDENAKLRDELDQWHRLTADIELPEYPITEFKPKDLERENAKLRELLSEIAKLVTNPYGGCLRPGCAHGCPHHLECDEELHTCFYVDRMRELGVEVD